MCYSTIHETTGVLEYIFLTIANRSKDIYLPSYGFRGIHQLTFPSVLVPLFWSSANLPYLSIRDTFRDTAIGKPNCRLPKSIWLCVLFPFPPYGNTFKLVVELSTSQKTLSYTNTVSDIPSMNFITIQYAIMVEWILIGRPTNGAKMTRGPTHPTNAPLAYHANTIAPHYNTHTACSFIFRSDIEHLKDSLHYLWTAAPTNRTWWTRSLAYRKPHFWVHTWYRLTTTTSSMMGNAHFVSPW